MKNTETIAPALTLKNPIAPGIERKTFVSSFDDSAQTYLEKNFGADGSGPLVLIYLHGALSHQEQGMTAGIYQNAFGRWGEELAARRAVYLCPEYRGNSWMGPAAESDVSDIIRGVKTRYPACRLILAGGSMGGTSALIYASHHPEALDGVIALCPATDPAMMFERFPDHFRVSYAGSPAEVPDVFAERTSRNRATALATLPISIVHGSADGIIDVEHSRMLVRLLREGNAWCHYQEIPGGDHDSPLQIPLGEMLDFVLGDESR